METTAKATRDWPAGDGGMRGRIRTHDWASTPLGPISSWPRGMKSAIDILLGLTIPGALLWGPDGLMIFNDAYAEFSDALHTVPLGSKVTESLPGDAEFNAHVMQTVLGGGSLAYRDREFLISRDRRQERIWLNLDYSPVLDDDGRPGGVFALIVDTSSRVQAQRALQSNQKRMAAIFAHATVGLAEVGHDGSFLKVNDEFCRFLGRTREELLRLHVLDITHPDDAQVTLDALKKMVSSDEQVAIDKRYLRSDGSTVWAHTSVTRLQMDDTQTALAVIVDLTKRKRAEQARIENEARFRALAEASPALIWQLDAEGNPVYVNPRYEELTGIKPGAIGNTGWRAFLHPEDAYGYLAAIEQAMQDRAPMRQRVRARDRNGVWHWLESHALPWYAADGSYAGHVGISIDITDLVHAQEELSVSNDRLKLAIEGSGDGVWDWEVPSGKLELSPRCRDILEIDPQMVALCYADWEERIHPDDAPEVQAALNACLKGKSSSYKSEHRIRCQNGEWKWVMARAIVVSHGPRNRPLRMSGTVTDISEKRRSEEIIWHHANFDTLTALPNRRLFRDRLDHEVRKANRTGLPMALLFIDLDRFKEANDLLGHDVGDLLLVEAARRISGCVRESDTVARLGGDEFTAILAELDDLAHVDVIAQKIIDTLAAPFSLGSEVVYLSASVGITLYPADARQPEDLIRNADQAMYAAKNGGRNQFSYFTRSMQQEAHARLRLIGELRKALKARQLKVYYQPVIDLASRRVVKAEALLRWLHPKLGAIEPARFIPLAEESGLINEIGEWVFRQAAARSREWSARLGMPFQISVNKSPVQFLSRADSGGWTSHLSNLRTPGSSISVEITEGLLLNASAGVANKLLQYRDAGIQVAIDDFGTGYSSMAYLRKFDIDYLKIDHSFVREIATDSGNRAIVRSIIAMAHELGLKVVAEGIETTEQEQSLIDAGCDFGQGFLFSQALPPEEFERVLRQ